MKLLRLLLPFLSLGIVLTACQKDYSAESGTAKGNIVKDAAGDCMPITVTGAFVKDVLIGAGTNYADVQVNIIQLGTYNIKSDTVNGYSFSATGYASIEGLTTVRLIASGKPIAAGLDLLTLKFDGSICTISNTVTATGGGGGGTAAVFTLNGSPTACAASTQTGSYNVGLATSSTSNTVTVFANVTTAGTYSISTALVNGVSFASGPLSFSSTGPNQQIILKANGGIPVLAGTNNYPITGAAGNCDFNVVYGAAIPPATFTVTCAGITSSGAFVAGSALPNTDVINVTLNATVAGAYSITTDIQNGVKFVASGNLALGNNPIQLRAAAGNNIPTTATTNTIYTIATSACTFPITYATAPVVTGTFVATIDGVVTDFNLGSNASATYFNAPVLDDLIISGNGTSPTSFILDIDKSSSGGTITQGPAVYVNTIAASIGGGYILSASYKDPLNMFWDPRSIISLSGPDNFTINITLLNATRVEGTFSGTIRDAFGTGTNTKTVTNGVFKVPIL